MGGRINTIMQTCFFAISGVLPADEAIAQIKKAIEKTYGKRAPRWSSRTSRRSTDARASPRGHGRPRRPRSRRLPPSCPPRRPTSSSASPRSCSRTRATGCPCSAFPVDGTWPLGTAQWEKRNIALEIPVWDPTMCIQCNKCALVCPHAAIRAKVYDPADARTAPGHLQVRRLQGRASSRARRTPSRWPPRTAPAAGSA